MRHHTFTNILKWSNKKHYYTVIKCTASLPFMVAIGNLSVFFVCDIQGYAQLKSKVIIRLIGLNIF